MHQEAILNLAATKSTARGIDAQLNSQLEKHHQQMLMKLLHCIKYLASQGIPFRGQLCECSWGNTQSNSTAWHKIYDNFLCNEGHSHEMFPSTFPMSRPSLWWCSQYEWCQEWRSGVGEVRSKPGAVCALLSSQFKSMLEGCN